MLAINFMIYDRSKHIEVRFYFLRDHVNQEMLKVVHYSTEMQLAELFIEVVKIDSFERRKKEIGVVHIDNLN